MYENEHFFFGRLKLLNTLFSKFQTPETTSEILVAGGFNVVPKGITHVKGKQPMHTSFVLPQPEQITHISRKKNKNVFKNVVKHHPEINVQHVS